MTEPRFLQIHTLQSYPAVLLNRDDAGLAKRVSAAVAIAMLYVCGHAWGRHAGLGAWRTGVVMVLLGSAVEAVIIALGG